MSKGRAGRGPRGFRGQRGKAGPTGRRGQRGESGQVGPAGERGAPGPPGELPNHIVAKLTTQLADIQRDLEIQFKRIAQLQADLDLLRAVGRES